MKIEIRHRFNNSVIFSHDADENSIKITLMMARKAGANLRSCDLSGYDLSGCNLRGYDLRRVNMCGCELSGCYLRGCDLRGAKLHGAKLDGKKLIGERPYFYIGPIGSRSDDLQVFITDQGVQLKAACFSGSIEEFELELDAEHGSNKHGEEYRAALVLIRKHAELWLPT